MTPSSSDDHTTQTSSIPTQEEATLEHHSDNLQAFRSDDPHDDIVDDLETAPDEPRTHPKTQVRQLFVGNVSQKILLL